MATPPPGWLGGPAETTNRLCILCFLIKKIIIFAYFLAQMYMENRFCSVSEMPLKRSPY